MPEVPKKKVGIVACSGEELPEGTVTRLAALKVLEELRPADTVTICLPLFLAGGEGDRAFARFYPTIALDGCEERCAARATEMYSGTPAASFVVSDLLADNGWEPIYGCRKLNDAGMQAVADTAELMAHTVDELLGKAWSRRSGSFIEPETATEPQDAIEATCACGSGIPVQEVFIEGQNVTLIALPVIFQQFHDAGKIPSDDTADELFDMVKIYNPIPDGSDKTYTEILLREYSNFCHKEEVAQ
ncbi:MAG: putative zinc-binding protein [Anaerolineales bacterium]